MASRTLAQGRNPAGRTPYASTSTESPTIAAAACSRPRGSCDPPRQRRLQPQVLRIGLEDRVGVEQGEAPAQAEGGDQAVHGVREGDLVLGAQAARVLDGEEGDLPACQGVEGELVQGLVGRGEGLRVRVASRKSTSSTSPEGGDSRPKAERSARNRAGYG